MGFYVAYPFGSLAGGYSIEITGNHFSAGMEVKIDNRVCEMVGAIEIDKIHCIVPPTAKPGKVSVKIDSQGQVVELENGFEYRPPLEPNYDSIYVNIFKPRCVGCHSGSQPPKQLDLSDYEAMMSHRRAIIPYDTHRSRVYKKVREGEMPRGGPPLSNLEIRTIAIWIQNGAKN
ncbi:MAG: IPT/TIG domain-containing protein [Deltaproteobacteria bacterium]